jgi:hypothetical protein
LEVEVTTSKNNGSSKVPTDSDYSEFDSQNEKQSHDAMVIEYCPRIFRELRTLDDITGVSLYDSLNPISNSESMNNMRESAAKAEASSFSAMIIISLLKQSLIMN